MTDDRYLSDQWLDYRCRARIFLWLLAGFFPVGVLILVALNAHSGEAIVATIAIAWVLGLCIAALRLQFFPCPNCEKPFAFKHLNNLPFFVDACVHCGLPKWEH